MKKNLNTDKNWRFALRVLYGRVLIELGCLVNKCKITKEAGIIQVKNRGGRDSKPRWMEKSWDGEESTPSLQLGGEGIKADVEKHAGLIQASSGSHLHIMVSIVAEKQKVVSSLNVSKNPRIGEERDLKQVQKLKVEKSL